MNNLISNFYSHYLLRKLRTKNKDNDKKYVIPKGWLFDYVLLPHYFFEIIAWSGYSLICNHINIYLQTIIFFGAMKAGAFQTRRWYKQKFPNHVQLLQKRKMMIPFIY